MTVPRGAWPRALAIASVAAALYAGTLGNDLVWDDRLTAAAPSLRPQPAQWWRPVVMGSFALDRGLWRDHAAVGLHLTNVVAHAGASVALDRWLLALGLGSGVALAGALAFAAHPLQTEAVAYVSGRTDVLCALGVLLALLAWRRARRALDAWAVAAAGFLALALGCKETAVAVPLVLLVPGAHPEARPPRPLLPAAVSAAWLLAFLVRAGAPGGARLDALVARVPAMAAIVAQYAALIVWPADLHLERFVAIGGRTPGAVAAVVAAAAMVLAALAAAARSVGGGAVLLALAGATYLPVAGIVPVYPAIADRALFAAEHFLYLPLAGLLPLLVAALPGWWPAGVVRRLAPAVYALVLAAWAAVTVDRVRDWRDEETLFRDTVAHDPPVARVWYNLGNLRLAAGDAAEAARLYEAALRREPGDAAAHLNLGIALGRLGRRDDALRHYTEALRLDPSLERVFRVPSQ